jgi:hypothetical protein
MLPLAGALPMPPTLGGQLLQQAKAHAQLLVGACLGVITTLFFSQASSSPTPYVAVQGLGLNKDLMVQTGPLGFIQGREGAAPNLLVSSPPAPPEAAQPSPQLKFIDRFYFASVPGTDNHSPEESGWLMVDRFYFSSLPEVMTSAVVFPQLPLAVSPAMAPSGQAGALAAPPPQVIPSFLNPTFHGLLEVPPPPVVDLSTGSQPLTSVPLRETEPFPPNISRENLHTLLGVVQTNHFGAALIKTQGSSYSVRVGEPIRQSRFRLTELESDRATLTDGLRKFVVNVGETF